MITLNITGTVWREMVWNQKRFMSPDFAQKKIRNWLVTEALRWTFPVSPNHVHKEEIFVPQLELNYKNTYFHFSSSMSDQSEYLKMWLYTFIISLFFNKHHWFFLCVWSWDNVFSFKRRLILFPSPRVKPKFEKFFEVKNH